MLFRKKKSPTAGTLYIRDHGCLCYEGPFLRVDPSPGQKLLQSNFHWIWCFEEECLNPVISSFEELVQNATVLTTKTVSDFNRIASQWNEAAFEGTGMIVLGSLTPIKDRNSLREALIAFDKGAPSPIVALIEQICDQKVTHFLVTADRKDWASSFFIVEPDEVFEEKDFDKLRVARVDQLFAD